MVFQCTLQYELANPTSKLELLGSKPNEIGHTIDTLIYIIQKTELGKETQWQFWILMGKMFVLSQNCNYTNNYVQVTRTMV